MQETKKLYAETKQKMYQRIEYLIAELRKIESEQEEILKVEEMVALKALEQTKLVLEQRVEETKQLLNMTALTLRHAQNASLLQQLQGGLSQKLQISSEIQSEPLLINIQNFKLTRAMDADKIHTKMQRIFGKLERTNIQHKITREGQLLDNHYLCQSISTCFSEISHRPIKTVKCLGFCFSFSFIDGHIYVPSEEKITIYDLDGSLMTYVQVPFYPLVIKKLSNDQLVVGSPSGLFCFNTLTQGGEAIQLTDGKSSDIDVYGDTFHVLKYDTSEILTFKLNNTKKHFDDASTQKSAWLLENTVKLSCISEPHNCNSFCRQEDTYLVRSIKDKCLFICDILGTPLKTIVPNGLTFICGIDQDENVVMADFHSNSCFAYDVKQGMQTSVLSALPGRPIDVLVDDAENVWVLIGEGEEWKLVQYSQKMC